MKRRNFVGSLFAIPFIGESIAMEAETFANPVKDTVVCDTKSKMYDYVPSIWTPYGAVERYIEFNVPMTKKISRMRVTGDTILEEIRMDLNMNYRKH